MKPYEVIVATRGSTLSPTQRHLLTHIALRSGEGGSCFASVATLREDTGFGSDRTVQTALRELVALGVLEAEEKRGRTTSYRVNVGAIPRVSTTPAAVAPPQEMHPRNYCTPAVAAPAPAIIAPDQILQTDPLVVPSQVEKAGQGPVVPPPEEPEQGKEPKGKAKANAARRADFSEAVRVWDEEVVPTARKAGATIGEHPRLDPSKALGKALRQRLDEQGLEAVLLVFRWYAGSSNSRASFLREGGHELSTLTRASKFEEYLGFARAEASSTSPKVGKAAHDAPEPTLYVVSDEERAKLREAKAAARAAIEADRLALEAKQQRLAARLGVPR